MTSNAVNKVALRCAGLLLWGPIVCLASVSASTSTVSARTNADPSSADRSLEDHAVSSSGSAKIAGQVLSYRAEIGTLIVRLEGSSEEGSPAHQGATDIPAASMSYVGYFLGDKPDSARPITFMFNGGPGSSTVWLHMGAFGPKRVIARDGAHTPAAPYRLVDNSSSLLPQSDIVFVDAPGTGFGQLSAPDAAPAFFGVDQDAHAFAEFIAKFISLHDRWNSPKYILGESYGTARAVVLAALLQSEKAIDLNGLILIAPILAFDHLPDDPQFNPSADLAYALVLPSYAATAWYHHMLPNPPSELETLLSDVERFALGEFLAGLAAGDQLPADRLDALADRLHAYTGLSSDYIKKANLRINAGMFEQRLMNGQTVGRLDSRFTGPSVDPLRKEAAYDPLKAGIWPAYVAVFNDYVRGKLHFGDGKTFRHYVDLWGQWDFRHKPPGASLKLTHATNVMPDLAYAMHVDPNLRVQMHVGYYDLATPYFASEFQRRHLAISSEVARNIEIERYSSGHMIFAHEPSLIALHRNVARFLVEYRGAAAGTPTGQPAGNHSRRVQSPAR